MAIDICPLAADWGNWADWAGVAVGVLAAVATISAVFVAVRTSRTSIDEARRMRDEQRDVERESERLRAVARAVTFDHEFFGLGGVLASIRNDLDPTYFSKQPIIAMNFLVAELPSDPMPMLTRFAGELDAFGAQDASKLLSILSAWNAVNVKNESIDDYGPEQALRLVTGVHTALGVLLEQLKEGRDVTMRWSAEVNSDPPATDW